MKKLMLFFGVFLFCCFNIEAQDYQETVYLKNGNVINGVIVEQIPNESLKIRTADGSIYVFYMDEVERITKRIVDPYYSRDRHYDDYYYRGRRGGRGFNNYPVLSEGYRGFVDLNYSLGVGDFGADRIEFTTSHGYQVNEIFYIGAGAGFNYYFDGEIASVPIFANPRVDFPTGNICPFIDMKIGYTVSEYIKGFYFVPSAGVRFGLQNGTGINIGVGYTLQKVKVDNYYSNHVTLGAVTIKLGFDF